MEINCGHFKLRSLRKEDKESLTQYANNRNIWMNLRDYFPHPYTVDDALAFIEFSQYSNTPTNWCIDLDNECVGIVGFKLLKDVYCKSADFGYWLGEPFWGRGIMSNAVQSAVHYIFNHWEINRIQAGVFEWNKASMRVLEKAGFEQEGIFKKAIFKNNQLIDEYRYGLLNDRFIYW